MFINDSKVFILNLFHRKTNLKLRETIRIKRLLSKKILYKELKLISEKLRLTKENTKQVLTIKFQKRVDTQKKQIDNNFIKI